MRPAVAVDIGGTKIAAALVAPSGEISMFRETLTPSQVGPDAILDSVGALIADITRGEAGGIAGVGVGTAGAVDTRSGQIISSTDTLRGWVGTDLRSGIAERVGCEPHRVVVHNDVNAHALGESWLGAATEAVSMLMVAVGTGVGGAIITNGRLWTGAHHLAGEIGHTPVPGAAGMICPCGRDGHLEALASGTAIAHVYEKMTGINTDARTIMARAEAGEPEAGAVVNNAAVGLGHAIAGLVTAIDPDRVVVGGGLAESGAIWWKPMIDTCRGELVDTLSTTPIERAALGPSAALLGAARGLFESLNDARRSEASQS